MNGYLVLLPPSHNKNHILLFRFIPPIYFYSYFIIKRIYISGTHNPLTYSTNFSLHFLKFMPTSNMTPSRKEVIFIKDINYVLLNKLLRSFEQNNEFVTYLAISHRMKGRLFKVYKLLHSSYNKIHIWCGHKF